MNHTLQNDSLDMNDLITVNQSNMTSPKGFAQPHLSYEPMVNNSEDEVMMATHEEQDDISKRKKFRLNEESV